MANLTTPIWKFTIADAGATLHRAADKPFHLFAIHWFGYALAANDIEITDGSDEILLKTAGRADLTPISVTFGSRGVPVHGLKVPLLDAGQVNVVTVGS